MRSVMILSASALALTAICLAAGDEPAIPQHAEKANVQPAPKAGARPSTKASAAPAAKNTVKAAAQTTARQAAASGVASEKISADEQAIRATGETFAKAYSEHDAKAVAAHFTVDAEYVDQEGMMVVGRPAIEASLATFFTENPDCWLKLNIVTIRLVSPGVAIEDGTTSVGRAEGALAEHGRYTAVHVKTGGKWLTASTRDYALKVGRQHAGQLQQLDWLVGNWVDEGDDSIVDFSCQVVDNGNFLLREFTVKIAGQAAISGSQRIGWDPLTGKLRAWTFDSEGGYGVGIWRHDGDRWIYKSTGITADGQAASGTSIYTLVSGHEMTWQAIDREIDGVRLPDTDEYTLVRAPPSLASTEIPVAKK